MQAISDPNKKLRGRPTKKVKPVLLALVRAVETGLPYTLCCQKVGVCYDTFMTWKREDPAFSQQVETAAANAAARLLAKIENRAQDNFAGRGLDTGTPIPRVVQPTRGAVESIEYDHTQFAHATIGLEEGRRLTRESEPIQAQARKLIENYRLGKGGCPAVDVASAD